jgi:hypothetical protein
MPGLSLRAAPALTGFRPGRAGLALPLAGLHAGHTGPPSSRSTPSTIPLAHDGNGGRIAPKGIAQMHESFPHLGPIRRTGLLFLFLTGNGENKYRRHRRHQDRL